MKLVQIHWGFQVIRSTKYGRQGKDKARALFVKMSGIEENVKQESTAPQDLCGIEPQLIRLEFTIHLPELKMLWAFTFLICFI